MKKFMGYIIVIALCIAFPPLIALVALYIAASWIYNG